jgi:membrane dipeptidase
LERRTFLHTSLLLGAQALLAPKLGLAVLRSPQPAHPDPFDKSVADLVRSTTVIDMLGLLTMDWAKLYSWQQQPSRLDRAELARLRGSGISIFHPAVDLDDPAPRTAAIACLDGWNRLLDAHQQDLLRIDNGPCLARVRAEGKIGVLLGFQNADHFGSVDDVDFFYGLGQRVCQLTYNERNRLGSGCTDPQEGGLSAFGAKVVEAMNRVGMAVDISHCGERTSLQAIDTSSRPILITHSNCRALVKHPRCKSDAVIKAMAQRGGVIGISVLPMMLSNHRAAEFEDVLDHIDHVASLVGPRHIGLGSDTDVDSIDPKTQKVRPAYRVRGLNSSRRVYDIAAGLMRRGYHPADVSAILGGNFQRVLTEIWRPLELPQST